VGGGCLHWLGVFMVPKLPGWWIVNEWCSTLASLAFMTAFQSNFITLFSILNKILDTPLYEPYNPCRIVRANVPEPYPI